MSKKELRKDLLRFGNYLAEIEDGNVENINFNDVRMVMKKHGFHYEELINSYSDPQDDETSLEAVEKEINQEE